MPSRATLPLGADSGPRFLRWARLLLAAPLWLACGPQGPIAGGERGEEDETGEEGETETGEGETGPDIEEEPPSPPGPIPGPAATGCELEQVWTGRGPSEFTEDGSRANNWHYAFDADGGFTVLAYGFVGGLDAYFLTSFDAELSQRWQRVSSWGALLEPRELLYMADGRWVSVGGVGSSLTDASARLEWFGAQGDALGEIQGNYYEWTGAQVGAGGRLLLAGEQSYSWSDPNGYTWGIVSPGASEPSLGSAGEETLRFIEAIHSDGERIWVAGSDEVGGAWLAELDAQGEPLWSVVDDTLGHSFEHIVAHEEGLLVAGRLRPEINQSSRSWLAVYSSEGELLQQLDGEDEVFLTIEDIEPLPAGGYVISSDRSLNLVSPQLEVEHNCRVDGPDLAWNGGFGEVELAGGQLYAALDGDPTAPGMPELRALVRVEGVLD